MPALQTRQRRPRPISVRHQLASQLINGLPHPPHHNGGPPLDDPDGHTPEWGRSGIRTYFAWKRAHNQVWKTVPHAIMRRRLQKARACGLTYEEYTLHLLETGRYLQPDDHDLINAIIAGRKG